MVIDYNQLLIENLESHNKIVEIVWLIKYILFKNILLTNKNIKTYLLCGYNLWIVLIHFKGIIILFVGEGSEKNKEALNLISSFIKQKLYLSEDNLNFSL